MGAAACSVPAAALVCNAAPSPLMLHGAPQLPPAVEIYRIVVPVVAPVVEPEQQPTPRPGRSKGLIWIGALIGGGAGCPIGARLGDAGEETVAAADTPSSGTGAALPAGRQGTVTDARSFPSFSCHPALVAWC